MKSQGRSFAVLGPRREPVTTFAMLTAGLLGLWGLQTLLVLFSLRSSVRTEGSNRPNG
jgi:hypothetical protein